MSLINDALKRAKQAQRQTPPPAASIPQLRPAEPPPPSAGRAVFIIALVTGVAMGTSLFIAWRAFQGSSPAPRKVPPTELSQSSIQTRQPEAKSSVRTTTSAPLQPLPSLVPPALTSDSPSPTANLSKLAPTTSAHDSAAENSPALSIPPPPKPEPLKLQGIVFNPRHPAAMILGKMLFVGDKLGEWQVSAITQDSATLIGPSQTNVLTLPQ